MSEGDPFSNPDYSSACRLVGHFMAQWGLMEDVLNLTLERLVAWDRAGGQVITANMIFSAKINSVRSIVKLILEDADDDHTNAWVADIAARALRMNDLRVTVAHSPFDFENGQLRFYRTTARDALKFPQQEWSEADWLRHCRVLNEIEVDLLELTRRMLS